MRKHEFIVLLRYVAVAGNLLFVLWILYNGINEGFKATTIEKISYFSLVGLLIINSILLLIKNNLQNQEK